jgi:Xaa-Pro aminopeptidase
LLLQKYAQVFKPGSMQDRAALHFRKRQQAFLKTLDAPALVFGLEKPPGDGAPWYSVGKQVYQDPSILYFTGINQAPCVLLFNPRASAAGASTILFLASYDARKEFWDGPALHANAVNEANATRVVNTNPQPGTPSSPQPVDHAQHVLQLTGVDSVMDIDTLEPYLQSLFTQNTTKHVYIPLHLYDSKRVFKDHNFTWRHKLQRLIRKWGAGVQIRTCMPQILQQRVVLDEYQLQDMRQAIHIAHTAFIHTIQALNGMTNENQIAAYLEYQMHKHTPDGLAFPTICACGANAAILHYVNNGANCQAGSLLLLDFGARCANAFSDISRTVPLNGMFNPLQQLLYSIVLRVQKANQARVQPGVCIAQLNQLSWEHMEQLLQTEFIEKGGVMRRKYPLSPVQAGTVVSPHGVSHLIGWQVHEGDPFRLYQHTPLQQGMVLSNEPGLYGEFSLTMHGEQYSEELGIRIEDDLLVTKDGCENLSAHIPKEVQEIQNLMANK